MTYFSTTLKGEASNWFSKLQANSIPNFADFEQKFLNEFRKPPNFFTFFEQLCSFKQNHP